MGDKCDKVGGKNKASGEGDILNKQGGGREGELSKKIPENNDLVQKITTFLTSEEGGGKINFFLKSAYWVV